MESSVITPCPHLKQIVNPQGLERLSRAAEMLFSLANRPVIGIAKEAVLRCLHPDCANPNSSDLYICVHSVHVACSARPLIRPLASSTSSSSSSVAHSTTKHPPPASGHLLAYYKSANQPLFLSVEHGQLFCAACNDFVFDQRTDAVISLQNNHARALRCRFNSALPSLDPSTTTTIATTQDSDPSACSEYSLDKPRQKRRRLVNLRDWVPSKKELEIISTHSHLFANTKGVVRPPAGLYNLGNSCYMNSVLQAFLNAPPLRNFFLSDEHKPNCQKESRLDCFACALETLVCESCFTAEGKPSLRDKSSSPSASTLDVPFLVPQMVLDIVWRNADHLASYAQHDAHEFLICALNLLNTHCRLEATEERKKEKGEPVLVELKLRKEGISPSKPGADVKRENQSPTGNGGAASNEDVEGANSHLTQSSASIIQRLFSGTLQSDVICRVCGNSSPKLEKFYDISLDVDQFLKPSLNRRGKANLPAGEGVTRQKSSSASGSDRGTSKSSKHEGKTEQADSQSNSEPSKQASHKASASGDRDNEKSQELANTLHECLARFTDPEMLLGSSSKMHCKTCGTKQEVMKQMSIYNLPPIVCFHFKRFEQSFASVRRSEMVKIDTPVEFPADGLNLTTFLTSEVLRKRTESEAKTASSRSGHGDVKHRTGPKKRKPESVRENEQTIYDLFAVVNHVGKIDSGHYTALVRRDGTWFRCDDEKVVPVDNVERIVRSEEAYLVFYLQRYPNIQY